MGAVVSRLESTMAANPAAQFVICHGRRFAVVAHPPMQKTRTVSFVFETKKAAHHTPGRHNWTQGGMAPAHSASGGDLLHRVSP